MTRTSRFGTAFERPLQKYITCSRHQQLKCFSTLLVIVRGLHDHAFRRAVHRRRDHLRIIPSDRRNTQTTLSLRQFPSFTFGLMASSGRGR